MTGASGAGSLALLAVALLVSVVAFVALFSVLDSVVPGLVGSAGPGRLEAEAGILATGVVCVAAGLGARSLEA